MPSTRYDDNIADEQVTPFSIQEGEEAGEGVSIFRRVPATDMTAVTGLLTTILSMMELDAESGKEAYRWASLAGIVAKANAKNQKPDEYVKSVLNTEAFSRGETDSVQKFEAMVAVLEVIEGMSDSGLLTSGVAKQALDILDKVVGSNTEIQSINPDTTSLRDRVKAKSIVGDVVKQYNTEVDKQGSVSGTSLAKLDLEAVLDNLDSEIIAGGTFAAVPELDIEAVLGGPRDVKAGAAGTTPDMEIVSSVLLNGMIRDVTGAKAGSSAISMLRGVYELMRGSKVRGDILGAFKPRGGQSTGEISGLSEAINALTQDGNDKINANAHAIARLIPHYDMVYRLAEVADRYWPDRMGSWRKAGGNLLELVNIVTSELQEQRHGGAPNVELSDGALREVYSAIDTSVQGVGDYYNLAVSEENGSVMTRLGDEVPSDVVGAMGQLGDMIDEVDVLPNGLRDGGYLKEGSAPLRKSALTGRLETLRGARKMPVKISVRPLVKGIGSD